MRNVRAHSEIFDHFWRQEEEHELISVEHYRCLWETIDILKRDYHCDFLPCGCTCTRTLSVCPTMGLFRFPAIISLSTAEDRRDLTPRACWVGKTRRRAREDTRDTPSNCWPSRKHHDRRRGNTSVIFMRPLGCVTPEKWGSQEKENMSISVYTRCVSFHRHIRSKINI